MTSDHNEKATGASERTSGGGRGADLFVIAAMGLVALAVSVALADQAGFAPAVAAGFGCAMFAMFVASHALFGKGSRRSRPAIRHKRKSAQGVPSASDAGPSPSDWPDLIEPLPGETLQEPAPVEAPAAAFEPTAGVVPSLEAFEPEAAPVAEAAPVLPVPGSADPMQSYWSYTPGAPRFELPPLSSAPMPRVPFRAGEPVPLPPLREEALGSVPPPPAPAASPRQEDVDVIHGLIKKLADEVNAAEQSEAARREAERQASIQASAITPSSPPVPPSIETSLDALRTAAGSMRAAVSEPFAPPAPAAVTPHATAVAIAEALRLGRLDVLLEPIVGLDDQRAHHYEVTLRLRGPQGETIDVDGERSGLAGSRILPLIDAVKLKRTTFVAGQLADRGKHGAVFSSYAGESLSDRGFLSDVVAALRARPETAGQLVLSFAQADVRMFGAAEVSALAELRQMGFRFALAEIVDLAMDFDALVRAGFAYAKLDADVLLLGLEAPSGHIVPGDVCRGLASHGMALVVDRIDSDTKRAQIFGFGVLLGQGQLFGLPRPVKTDVAQGPATAAA